MHIPGKRGSPLWLLCNQPNYKNYGEIHIEGVDQQEPQRMSLTAVCAAIFQSRTPKSGILAAPTAVMASCCKAKAAVYMP